MCGVKTSAVLITDGGSNSMDFERLMSQHEARVLRVALRITGNLADAQDSAQEVFMRLHHQLRSLDGPEAVAPWLHRVTVNVCFDLGRRARGKRMIPIDGLTLVSSQRNPEKLSLEREGRDQLQTALAQIGERERAALVLRELEGLTTAEVAEAMGTTESTVRVQITKARLKLRELLKGVRA